MNSKFRLKQSSEFMRVRRFGKSYAHPLIVLVVLTLPKEKVRIGVTAGRSVGNAVERNRAKRMLRESIRPFIARIKTGCYIILIARKPILNATLPEIKDALDQLLEKTSVLNKINGSFAQA